jgi:hypothetical protein
MNIINKYGLYIFIFVAILASIVLFYFNFTSVLKFKWYIDYYKSINDVCNKSHGSKLELENLRYSIYSFLYNDDNEITLSKLKNDFKTSFYIFISYYTLFVIIFLTLSVYYNQYYNVSIYIFLFVIYVTYTTTNAIVVKNFDDIQKHKDDDVYNINIYANVYKILNAIMVIGNIANVPMKYADNYLNYEERSFDDILENNISSSENARSSSQVLKIKQKSYDRLDFAKYLTYDKSSHFFIQYFEDIYIRLPTSSNVKFDISDNIRIKDIYTNRNNSSNFVEIKNLFQKVHDKIAGETRESYVAINNKILNEYPLESTNQDIEYKRISFFLNMIEDMLQKDIRIKQYNLLLYEEINEILLSIRMILRNSQYNDLYEEVNDKILELFKQKQIKISVPENDFIKYYIENSDIIINEDNDNKEFKDIIGMLNYQGEFIYSYVVYIAIIFLMISHYLYVSLNSQKHSLILITAIALFITYFYLSSVSSPL